MTTRLIAGAGIAALLLSAPAWAHHPSGASSAAGAGPINTISATTLERGESTAAFVYEAIKFRAFSDAELAAFAGAHIHAHSVDMIMAPTLLYAYGVTKDLTLIARLPYVLRTDIREGSHHHGGGGVVTNEAVDRGDSAGIGDLTVMGQFRFLNNRQSQTEAAILLGVKTPTGRTNVKDNDGERFETEFQPGSGSWDGLFGLAATQRVGRWSFDANVLYQLVTEGAQDTDLGDRFQYNVAISYRVLGAAGGPMYVGALPEPMYHGGPNAHRHHHREAPPVTLGPALDLVLELNGEWHAREEITGVKEPNSGGTTVYLSPGLRYGTDNWSSFVSVGVPVVSNLNGVQTDPDWRVLAGFSVSFR